MDPAILSRDTSIGRQIEGPEDPAGPRAVIRALTLSYATGDTSLEVYLHTLAGMIDEHTGYAQFALEVMRLWLRFMLTPLQYGLAMRHLGIMCGPFHTRCGRLTRTGRGEFHACGNTVADGKICSVCGLAPEHSSAAWWSAFVAAAEGQAPQAPEAQTYRTVDPEHDKRYWDREADGDE